MKKTTIIKPNYEIIEKALKEAIDNLEKKDSYEDIREIPNYVVNLMEDLLSLDLNDENNKSLLVKNICRVYEKHGRFSYSQITSICYSFEDKDKEERILWNLIRLHEYCDEKDNEKKDIVFKLYDHINLAIKQSNKFRNITTKFDEKIKQEEQIIENKTKQAIETVNETKKKLMGELISLIGIFTALSFVLFGGISSIGSLTNSIEAVLNNNYDISIIYRPIIIWGIVMFNVLYLFMYFIFKLTGNSRSIFKEDGFCSKIKLFLSKYSLVILTNCLLFLLYCKL